MIETSLNVTDYLTPPEVLEKQISGSITLKFNFEDEVPESWDNEDIKRYIKENLGDYIDLSDIEEIEIDL